MKMKTPNKDKRVIIYCRESRDEGFKDYERIETQRDILLDFCKRQGLETIIDIVMDDNKSGAVFDRLLPIKARITNKEVDVLVCKDASRIGRNILESLNFIEFLNLNSVELLFESEQYNEEMFPLIAWFNERRIKDDSLKIRRVLRHKMEKGEMVIAAPFGYLKKGNTLVVDEPSADIVKEIFSMFITGFSMTHIARILNEKNYKTPAELKQQYAGNNNNYLWNKQHINRILSHEAYTGAMVYGMREKVSYKSKKYINKAKSDWIVVPNHHESIISEEIFKQANEILKLNKKHKIKNANANIFSGIIYCGKCQSKMYRKTRNGRKPSYICSKNIQSGSMGCETHSIREEVLIKIVINCLIELIKQTDVKIIFDEYNFNSEISHYEKQIQQLIDCNNTHRKKASVIYEDKLKELIPEYLFKEKMQEINKSISENELEIKMLLSQKEILLEENPEENIVQKLIETINNIELNRSILTLMFKRFIIFNPNDAKSYPISEYMLSKEDIVKLQKEGGIILVTNFKHINNTLFYTL